MRALEADHIGVFAYPWDPCSTTPTTPKSPANPSIFHFLQWKVKPRQPAKVAERWRGATYVSGRPTCSFIPSSSLLLLLPCTTSLIYSLHNSIALDLLSTVSHCCRIVKLSYPSNSTTTRLRSENTSRSATQLGSLSTQQRVQYKLGITD